ncbi:hypothetical protein [uncultured Bacteroides sp.]|nr:hypothetical protein [uncultured Bacteroides sp.]
MKKSNLLFSAVMALAMGSLASCASDDLVTDIQGQEWRYTYKNKVFS